MTVSSANRESQHPTSAVRKAVRAAPVDDRPAVLIVDDVPDNVEELETALWRDDIEILTACSGRDALEVLLRRDVAAAIIDVMMPDMDGFELADRIRSAAETQRVPIIFVTSGSRAQYRAFTAYETGAIDFLYKPLDVRTLRAKVDVLVTLEQQRRSLDRALNEAERARAETEILLKLAQGTSKSARPEDVFNPALDAVRELFGTDRASILTFGDSDRMRFRAWRGLSDAYRTAVDGHSPWSRAETDAQPILISDVEADESMAPYRPTFAAESIRALGFVPLLANRELLGKFMLYWDEPRVFSDHDRSLAQAIASQIADSLDRARLREVDRAHAETVPSPLGIELRHRLDAIVDAGRRLERDCDQRTTVALAQGIVANGEVLSGMLDRLIAVPGRR
jgi:CheY-like chemotaxis protein